MADEESPSLGLRSKKMAFLQQGVMERKLVRGWFRRRELCITEVAVYTLEIIY